MLLLIRKIETLHLRGAQQHVVGTDVGSWHSCAGRGRRGEGRVQNAPQPRSLLSCTPLLTATPGPMTPSEVGRPGPGKGGSEVQRLRAQLYLNLLCDPEPALTLSVPWFLNLHRAAIGPASPSCGRATRNRASPTPSTKSARGHTSGAGCSVKAAAPPSLHDTWGTQPHSVSFQYP